ncbi:hypothetical protein P886_1903 [Alteromonadaceae bacterium 2753L.S.0a.02]|nr:hypothetical protein P886_1903 [Alteromonadaceae bacterium 2753L.S.0a.02]
MNKNVMSAALAAAVASAATAGEYKAGDFHNHTTCSDGSTSVKTLTRKSLEYLDWFIHVGHSGRGNRDCNVSDFLYLNRDSEFNRGLWVNTVGSENIKGDAVYDSVRTGTQVQSMWRWQSLQEYNFPSIVEERELPPNAGKTAFLGVEWVVPGHEHSSNSISTGQYDLDPNADALSQFEYCFARNSDDTSMGGGQGWTCELSNAGNEKIKALFAGRPEEGIADYNSTLIGGINTSDTGEHVKSTAAVLWMQENFEGEAFAVQSHVERQGAFVSASNRGYNVEHMRDWNSVAPDVAFGFETQPGHQPVGDRGSYAARRPTAGLYTFGGTGCYGAAEAAKPGLDFNGTPLTQADFGEDGKYPLVGENQNPARVTLCRPGVRTMWDAMLSEGRKFWFFASSDWHSRGAFGPLDYESTSDFWPGEYQENFVWMEDRDAEDPAKQVVDGLRSGNSYTVQGQLIDGNLSFKACAGWRCATMGETLKVYKGEQIHVSLIVTDPAGKNNSVYSFNNPSLLQIGQEVPLNEPELAQVDLIMGQVTSVIEPSDPEYYNPLAPQTTRIEKTWNDFGGPKGWGHGYGYGHHRGNKQQDQTSFLHYSFKASTDAYVRARGTNIPAGTPNERDMYGNPLSDHLSDNIACSDPACPPHINGILDNDVEAWADIWFHTNPIFIEIVNK